LGRLSPCNRVEQLLAPTPLMTMPKRSFLTSLALLGLALMLLLTGCHPDHVAVDHRDPKTPQYAYRLDELALLQMAVDDIQEMERDKRYGKIYDEFASPEFKAKTSRRRFLIWANCAETYLGGVEEYDRNELGFFREPAKNKQPTVDSLLRTIHRSHFTAKERMGFVYDGIHFKLHDWTWVSNDKTFLQCMADSPRLEGGAAQGASSEMDSQKTANGKNGIDNSSPRTDSLEPNVAGRLPQRGRSDSRILRETEDNAAPSSVLPDSKPAEEVAPAEQKEDSANKGDKQGDSPPMPQDGQANASTPPSSLHYARARWHRPIPAPVSSPALPSSGASMPHKASSSAAIKSLSPPDNSNSPPVPGQD
jgi:hypothetical protein